MSRDYKKEYAEYHSLPEQKKNRAKRNKANRNSNTKPGQEVDHKVPLSQGGSNSPNNWRVVSKETNRKKGSKKMSSFDNLRIAIQEKTAWHPGYEDDATSTSNYINMSGALNNTMRKGTGESGMYRQVRIVDSPLENRSFLGFDQGPEPYVLSENAARLREELAKIEGLDVAPETYTENWVHEGPVVEYGHVGRELGEEKEKLILEALKRGRIPSKEKTAAPEGVERLPSGGLKYRGETFPGYNKPKRAPAGSKHKNRVLAKKGDKVKAVNFGARGYKHNYSAKAKKSYLARSGGIKGKDDKFSANYWSRKVNWPKNQKADGSSKKAAAEFNAEVYWNGLTREQQKAMEDAITSRASAITAEMNKELEPLQNKLNKTVSPYEAELAAINKKILEQSSPYQQQMNEIFQKHNPRLNEAILAGYADGGASEEFINYIRNQQANAAQAAQKTASAALALPFATAGAGNLLGRLTDYDWAPHVGSALGLLGGSLLYNKYINPRPSEEVARLIKAELKGPKELKKVIKAIDKENEIRAAQKTASADCDFDTSSLEAIMLSAKK